MYAKEEEKNTPQTFRCYKTVSGLVQKSQNQFWNVYILIPMQNKANECNHYSCTQLLSGLIKVSEDQQ